MTSQPPPSSVPEPRLVVDRAFLLTDIVGSTILWARHGDTFRVALEIHHRVLREEMARHDGRELDDGGDGFLLVFDDLEKATACAIAMQCILAKVQWPGKISEIPVRMGLHIGEVTPRELGKYTGYALNVASRVGRAARGGQVLCSDAAARRLEGNQELVDLGLFRLRDVPEPERLCQLCWPEMPKRSFPLPDVAPAFTHNLPLGSTRFFGRTGELERLSAMLREPVHRLLTLTGAGGAGKTRLSLMLGQSLRGEFAGAVWFVPLEDLSDAALLPEAMRDALKIEPEPGRDPFDQVVGFLKRQPSVVLLDNFEQFHETGADLVHRLLTRAPELKCVVTSRHRLNVPGEREFAVAPLPVPAPNQRLEELLECESVKLFIDRAQAVRSEFQVVERNAGDVARLCRCLDGVPLALELAAARSDVMTPGEMLEGLADRLDTFASTMPHLPTRHRSLRAAIDWSFDFLPPALRGFFANLSVFRGGWTAEAAENVAITEGLEGATTNVRRALSELRGSSLLQAEERDGKMRFRMLETLREYAAEQLGNKAAEIQGRHSVFFAALVEKAEASQRRGDQAGWLNRLESEAENLRAALATPAPVERRAGTAAALSYFWLVRGYAAEGRAELARFEMDSLSDALRAEVDNASGILSWADGDLESARAFFERALGHYRTANNIQNVAGILNNLGTVSARQRDLKAACAYFEDSLRHYEGLPLDMQRAQALANLGAALMEDGDLAGARARLSASLIVHEDLKDDFGSATALHNLAHLSWLEGREDHFEDFIDRSVALNRKLRHFAGLAVDCELRARRESSRGDHASAAGWLGAVAYFSREFDAGGNLNGSGELVKVRAQAGESLGIVEMARQIRAGELWAAECAAPRENSESN